jgi:putative DNA primase/helicase
MELHMTCIPSLIALQLHKQFQLTDLGNAERFAALHQSRIRYCWTWNKWMHWTGKKWQEDSSGVRYQLAKATIANIEQEARNLLQQAKTEEEQDRAEAIAKWAKSSQSNRHIEALISLARAEKGIPVHPSTFDNDLMLRNCHDGTIDLWTGKLQQHNREHYITKMCPVEYDPNAVCPKWDEFLNRVQPNIRNRKYLQRFTGYSTTGDVSERIMAILYGTRDNGKSVYISTVCGVLGEYAVRFPKELLLQKRNEDHPTDRAVLFGSRFAWTGETSQGRWLDEGTVKELTRGDDITTRLMREDFWTYTPTHKLWLATNHKPVIRGIDRGIWNKIRLIPFTPPYPMGRRTNT